MNISRSADGVGKVDIDRDHARQRRARDLHRSPRIAVTIIGPR